jgi:hypothetical protein
MDMLIFSGIVLALNFLALLVNIMAGNTLNSFLCLLVLGVVGYYVWRDVVK